MIRRALAPLLLLAVLAGCRSTAPLPAPVPPQPPPAAIAAAKPATAEPDSIRWVRDAAEYRALTVQAYRLATMHVETEAKGRAAGTWAVVLDADETIISNLTYQAERARQGLAYSTESWAAWVKRRESTPVPGAAAFLTRVRALGGRIAVVTNRLQSECDDTAAVFARHQLIYDAMLCRPDGASSDKNPRFQAVAAGQTPAGASPLEVVAFVGDNILDFPGLGQSVKDKGEAGLEAFGSRFFVLPNPMYGSWQ